MLLKNSIQFKFKKCNKIINLKKYILNYKGGQNSEVSFKIV